MEFLGGALPNVMFIIGILAIGLGLGIELKLVALNKEIDKTGRIGAIVIGIVLVAASLFIYLNPALTSHNQTSSVTANAAQVPTLASSTSVMLAVAMPPEVPTALAAPTATIMPINASAIAPVPSPVPQIVTAVLMVKVPNVHDLDEKGAQAKLSAAKLKFSKVDQCSGSDQGSAKPKKHRVLCQNPAPDSTVAVDTVVEYVIR